MRAGPALWRLLPRTVLSLGVVLCFAASLEVACDGPAFFDYDDATQGIFTNDLTRGAGHDASFRGSEAPQDVYRANWSVQRLPYSLTLSFVQRLLGVPPHRVELVIGGFGLLLAAMGSVLAALALARDPGGSAVERWAIAAFVAAHPGFVPFVRTGASFYLLAFALFWGSVYCTVRYAESGSARWLQALAFVLAVFALNPYPPLATLPLVLPLVLFVHGRLRDALTDRRMYRAAAAGALVFGGVSVALALVHEASLGGYLRRIAAFQTARAHAVSLDQLTAWSPAEKLAAYLNQHLLFTVDALGDASREDWIWTLGRPSYALLAALPLMAVGAVAGLRRRERSTQVCVAVLAATGALFATLSFPEGRYLLPLVPCYAFLATRGARSLVPNPRARELALGVALSLFALETASSLSSHERAILERWPVYDGMREAAAVLATLDEESLLVSLPGPRSPEASLYFRMVMPPQARWASARRFERQLAGTSPGRRLVAVEYADDEQRLEQLRGLGFFELGRFTTRLSHRPMRILARPPA